MELLGVDPPHSLIAFVLRRLARAVVAAAMLLLIAGAVATSGSGACAPGACAAASSIAGWLGGAGRLDFGRTVEDQPVAPAIVSALPATVLLLALTLLIGLVFGWIAGIILALAECRTEERTRRRRAGLAIGRRLAIVTELCQAVPIFWLGGLLAAVLSIGAGWLPPGGIADPTAPAFGSAGYLDALGAQPLAVLLDLLRHLILPSCTLALAGLATTPRLFRVTLPPIWAAQHTRVARAAGLGRRRLARRAVREALPAVLAGAAAGTPLLLSALVLVEYVFGWPGIGLLAYHAARAGDMQTLGALLLLSGLAAITLNLLAELLAAIADPRLREPAP